MKKEKEEKTSLVNKVLQYIKNMLADKRFWIFLIITLIFYGALYRLSYSRCTYRMYFYDWKEEFKHYLGVGRYLVAFCWGVVSVLKFSFKTTYILSYILAIMSLTLAMYRLSFIVEKLIKNDKMTYFICTLIVLNAYLIDFFLYIEKGVMAFSILMVIISFGFLYDYFETKNRKKLLYVLGCMLLTNFAYQATGGLFVSLSLILILKYSKDIKEFLKNNVLVALLYGIPIGINYIMMKFTYPTERNLGEIDFIESTIKIIKSLDKLFVNSYSILPRYFFSIVLLTVVIGFVVNTILNKTTNNVILKNIKLSNKLQSIIGLIYIFVGCLVVTIFPQYSLSTADIYLSPRCTIGFASIIGILILYLFYVQNTTKFDKKFYMIISLIYLIVQFTQLQFIIQDLHKVNELDMITAKEIERNIKEYEEQTGIEIKNVVYYQDKYASNSYPDIISFNEINQKIITRSWRNLSVLGYFTGRDLQLQKSEEYYVKEYQEYYSTKNWDYFDKDQLRFVGDTLHWCLF